MNKLSFNVMFNHTAGGAMSKSDYLKPRLQRHRLK